MVKVRFNAKKMYQIYEMWQACAFIFSTFIEQKGGEVLEDRECGRMRLKNRLVRSLSPWARLRGILPISIVSTIMLPLYRPAQRRADDQLALPL